MTRYPVAIGTVWQHFNGTFWQIVGKKYEDVDEDYVTAKKLRTNSVFLFRKKEWYETMTFESEIPWSTNQ